MEICNDVQPIGSLTHFERAFASVGWFLPPFASMGFLSDVAVDINAKGDNFEQNSLQEWLGRLYEPSGLAAMVCNRYSVTPIICEYKKTIEEAIQAHFLGLHHIAIGGLVPVIEGAGRDLLSQRGCSNSTTVENYSVKKVFEVLCRSCIQEAIKSSNGETGEIISMMNSFSSFTNKVLYVESGNYPFLDKTNRHGITHGAYKDRDYGQPINFYKTIGAVDFLCFVAAFRANISWLSPSLTAESIKLSDFYRVLQYVALNRSDGI